MTNMRSFVLLDDNNQVIRGVTQWGHLPPPDGWVEVLAEEYTDRVQQQLDPETGDWLPQDVVDVPVDQASVDSEAEATKAMALQYLKDTDWMVIRQMETGEEIPNDVKSARAEARVIASD